MMRSAPHTGRLGRSGQPRDASAIRSRPARQIRWVGITTLLTGLAVPAISSAATGASNLDGLEMDVMLSGERPTQAAHRIALPPPAIVVDAPELTELDDPEALRDDAAPALAPDDVQPALAPEVLPAHAD